MPIELISKRTRNEFREFLTGWTLREIEQEFDAAGIKRDTACNPQVSGERRTLVEQYYHTLDLSDPRDARRLANFFAGMLQTVERLAAEPTSPLYSPSVDLLKEALAKDGIRYDRGQISAASPSARTLFDDHASGRTISEITRRQIFDELSVGGIRWSGRLSEPDFLGRLYDLAGFPSHDHRFKSMAGDIYQHRENNLDWPDDWVFTDSRINLLEAPDGAFLRFLCETLHPAVRTDPNEVAGVHATFNTHLSADGWELAQGKAISGKPTFVGRQLGKPGVILPPESSAHDALSDDYVRELSGKCDDRLADGDLEGAVTVARTLLEAILGALELRISGKVNDYKGDLPRQFKAVGRLLKMDDQRADLDERFKDVIRGLVTVVGGLAPLRSKIGDSHARVTKPPLHHARFVVNAAKTVSAFLVESYGYQRAKGQA